MLKSLEDALNQLLPHDNFVIREWHDGDLRFPIFRHHHIEITNCSKGQIILAVHSRGDKRELSDEQATSKLVTEVLVKLFKMVNNKELDISLSDIKY